MTAEQGNFFYFLLANNSWNYLNLYENQRNDDQIQNSFFIKFYFLSKFTAKKLILTNVVWPSRLPGRSNTDCTLLISATPVNRPRHIRKHNNSLLIQSQSGMKISIPAVISYIGTYLLYIIILCIIIIIIIFI